MYMWNIKLKNINKSHGEFKIFEQKRGRAEWKDFSQWAINIHKVAMGKLSTVITQILMIWGTSRKLAGNSR